MSHGPISRRILLLEGIVFTLATTMYAASRACHLQRRFICAPCFQAQTTNFSVNNGGATPRPHISKLLLLLLDPFYVAEGWALCRRYMLCLSPLRVCPMSLSLGIPSPRLRVGIT